MRAWTTARFTIPLPAGHRFPIAKYAMIRDRAGLDACRSGGLPVAMVMAGGYAEDLNDLATIQVNSGAELRRSHG